MNLFHIRSFLILSLVLLFSSCTEKGDSPFTDTPIIEGYLVPDQFVQVKIRRQYPFSENVTYSADRLDSLDVYLTFDNQSVKLKHLGDGVYGDSSVFPTVGTYYELTFHFNNKKVSAYTYLPEKPQNLQQSATSMEVARMDSSSGFPGSFSQPSPIELSWTNNDRSYYLTLVENLEVTLDPIIDFGSQDRPGAIFRKSPSVTSSESLRSMEFQYFGTHAIVVCHVLPDYASMYGDNSSSSLNLTNPSGSIVNGYGIFTGLNADTVYVEIIEQ